MAKLLCKYHGKGGKACILSIERRASMLAAEKTDREKEVCLKGVRCQRDDARACRGSFEWSLLTGRLLQSIV